MNDTRAWNMRPDLEDQRRATFLSATARYFPGGRGVADYYWFLQGCVPPVTDEFAVEAQRLLGLKLEGSGIAGVRSRRLVVSRLLTSTKLTTTDAYRTLIWRFRMLETEILRRSMGRDSSWNQPHGQKGKFTPSWAQTGPASLCWLRFWQAIRTT
jgi:hypothetical protein